MTTVTELIVDAYDCMGDLNDAALLESVARETVRSIGATVLTEASAQFQPHGVTVCLVLKESHFIISTWPEHGYASVNIFLCNPSMSVDVCWNSFKKHLKPKSEKLHRIEHQIGRRVSKKTA